MMWMSCPFGSVYVQHRSPDMDIMRRLRVLLQGLIQPRLPLAIIFTVRGLDD